MLNLSKQARVVIDKNKANTKAFAIPIGIQSEQRYIANALAFSSFMILVCSFNK